MKCAVCENEFKPKDLYVTSIEGKGILCLCLEDIESKPYWFDSVFNNNYSKSSH